MCGQRHCLPSLGRLRLRSPVATSPEAHVTRLSLQYIKITSALAHLEGEQFRPLSSSWSYTLQQFPRLLIHHKRGPIRKQVAFTPGPLQPINHMVLAWGGHSIVVVSKTDRADPALRMHAVQLRHVRVLRPAHVLGWSGGEQHCGMSARCSNESLAAGRMVRAPAPMLNTKKVMVAEQSCIVLELSRRL